MRLVKQLQSDLHDLKIETDWYASRARHLEDKLDALATHLNIEFLLLMRKPTKARWILKEIKE